MNYFGDAQVIRACDHFNGRIPIKGMPPGIYAEGSHEDGGEARAHYGLGSLLFLVLSVLVVVVCGTKVARDLRRDEAAAHLRGTNCNHTMVRQVGETRFENAWPTAGDAFVAI